MLSESSDLQSQALATATALPARFYTGEGTAAIDQTAVFNRHWQYVCHSSQIADEGDYVVSVLGQLPVIVIRTAEGLRGYHNVCRHRAGPLAQCSGKGAKQLRCRYHGWTYNLDGSLRTAVGTTNLSNVPVDHHPQGVRESSPKVVVYFDIEKKEWRSVSRRVEVFIA